TGHLTQDICALAYQVAGDLAFRAYHDLGFGRYQAVYLSINTDVPFTYNIALDRGATAYDVHIGRRQYGLAFAFRITVVVVKHRFSSVYSVFQFRDEDKKNINKILIIRLISTI